MKKHRHNYIKEKFFPITLFSLITGILTGIVIFLFKMASSHVISLSGKIFGFVRANPIFIPLLVLAAAAVGVISHLITHYVSDCRGGGIPSAILVLRGHVTITKIIALPMIFISSLLTYICGVPLGTEGPSVQMGTIVGWITWRLFGKKKKAWRRYVMTGGACSSFATATGSPLSGIFFAFEEVYHRFTPMVFLSASLAVVVSTAVMDVLCSLAGISSSLFHFEVNVVMSVKYMWSAFIIGIACGIIAIFFTKAYKFVVDKIGKVLRKVPYVIKMVSIFVIVSLVGVAFADCIGTGHGLIDEIILGRVIWYLLILFFLVRAFLMMISNSQGVTGGLFIPTLAFGAMIGALCGKAMIGLGILPKEYYIITILIGMSAFLSAASRIPLTALAFAIEALSGITNFLPIAIGVVVSYAVIEFVGIESFTDAVIEAKKEKKTRGKKIIEAEREFVIKEGAFAVGFEVKDVFWPPNCVVVSIVKNKDSTEHHGVLSEGDRLCIHYKTAYPEEIIEQLEDFVGKQS